MSREYQGYYLNIDSYFISLCGFIIHVMRQYRLFVPLMLDFISTVSLAYQVFQHQGS